MDHVYENCSKRHTSESDCSQCGDFDEYQHKNANDYKRTHVDHDHNLEKRRNISNHERKRSNQSAGNVGERLQKELTRLDLLNGTDIQNEEQFSTPPLRDGGGGCGGFGYQSSVRQTK